MEDSRSLYLMTVSYGYLAIPISIILIRRRELFPAFFKYEIQDWSSRRETGKRKPQQPFYNLVNDGICFTGLMTRRISFSGRGVVWSSMIGYLYLCILFAIQAKADLLVLKRSNRKCGQRSEEHTSELQSRGQLVCRLLLEKKQKNSAHS